MHFLPSALTPHSSHPLPQEAPSASGGEPQYHTDHVWFPSVGPGTDVEKALNKYLIHE